MKKAHSIFLIGALAAAIAAIAACAPQLPPGDGRVPVPDEEMARLSGRDLDQLKDGYIVYHKQCSQCHIPMLPKEVSEGDWHIVVPGMAWNAGIDKEDEEAVLQYLLAAREMPKEASKAE